MAGVLEIVDRRTQLAGYNRLELLLFWLNSKQRFGINVFKVREVLECPALRRLPGAHAAIRGLAHVRGRTLPVIDIGLLIGEPEPASPVGRYLVITEFNRSVQGFLIGTVDRIVNREWAAVLPPPQGMGANGYLTAITHVDGDVVAILDVEKLWAEVFGADLAPLGRMPEPASPLAHRVLIVDDSSTARKLIGRTLESLGLSCLFANDGAEALGLLQRLAREPQTGAKVALVISDIEMPRMDGYTLTAQIRRDPQLKGLAVLLHSSLSGVFNDAMVKQVGADRFLPKFNPQELGRVTLEMLSQAPALPASTP
jgi:two-component system chemotaxis response regulator CheV